MSKSQCTWLAFVLTDDAAGTYVFKNRGLPNRTDRHSPSALEPQPPQSPNSPDNRPLLSRAKGPYNVAITRRIKTAIRGRRGPEKDGPGSPLLGPAFTA